MLIANTPPTIVRVLFDEKYQTIKELEFLRIVSETSKTLHLSNGKTVCKESLFPYHKKNFFRDQEYFYLNQLIL